MRAEKRTREMHLHWKNLAEMLVAAEFILGKRRDQSLDVLDCRTRLMFPCHLTIKTPSASGFMRREPHDGTPPQNWPEAIQYLTKPRLSPTFPRELIPLLQPGSSSTKLTPSTALHPASVQIKPVKDPSHPANGQNGLFAKRKFGPGELIIPYLGLIHATLIPTDPIPPGGVGQDVHEGSDYDLQLLSLSCADARNPFGPEYHISIGVDAAQAGNAGRMVNDFRGIAAAPNAEFRVGQGVNGELRMEIWTLPSGKGIAKGEEVLVSYGKGWWDARRS